MSLIYFILIGLAAGWLAGMLLKEGQSDVLRNLIVGVIGSLLGGFLFHTAGISIGGGLLGELFVATIGAIVLLYLLRFINKRS